MKNMRRILFYGFNFVFLLLLIISFAVDVIGKTPSSDNVLFVYGTQSSNVMDTLISRQEAVLMWKHRSLKSGKLYSIKKDVDIKKEDLEQNNLVLYGTFSSNRIITFICDKFPVRLVEGGVIIGDREYRDENLKVVIYMQNPFNYENNLTVYYGASWRGICNIHQIHYEDINFVVADCFNDWLAKGCFKKPKDRWQLDIGKMQFRDKRWEVAKGKKSLIKYQGIKSDYIDAILKICDTAWEAFGEIYGIVLTQPIKIYISHRPRGEETKLWTNTIDTIYWQIKDDRDLRTPETGYNNIYGICHELAHITLTTDNHQANEAWADYAAAVEILPYIHARFGDNIWPQAHSYLELSGENAFLSRIVNNKIGKGLYVIGKVHGAKIFGEAIKRAYKMRPPTVKWQDFIETLSKVAQDSNICVLFNDEERINQEFSKLIP